MAFRFFLSRSFIPVAVVFISRPKAPDFPHRIAATFIWSRERRLQAADWLAQAMVGGGYSDGAAHPYTLDAHALLTRT